MNKFNEIYRTFTVNEERGIFFETSDKQEDYEHFRTKTPLSKCFFIEDNSGITGTDKNYERRLNNLNKVTFRTDRCEFMSIS
jgi:hypothetical protein